MEFPKAFPLQHQEKHPGNEYEMTPMPIYYDDKYIKKGDILTLNGELGSGKTVFLMGIASYFGIEDDVCSPTFTIVNEYNTSKDFPIYHFDVYRLHDSDEFLEGVIMVPA